MLPTDLKDYPSPPGFVIFTSDEVVVLLGLLLAGAVVVDVARQLCAWLFA